MSLRLGPRNLVERKWVLAFLAFAPMPAAVFAQPAKPSVWLLSFYGREAYETNVEYSPVGGQDDFITEAGARLLRRFPVKRGRLDLALDGGVLLYRSHTELNRFTWTASADGARNLSRRASVEVNVRSSQGYARDNPVLGQTGVVPSYALTRTDSGALSLRYRFSRVWEWRLGAEGSRYDFRSPGLQNGGTATARAHIQRAVGPASILGASADYERTASGGQKYEIERVFGVWRHTVARSVAVRLEAGLAGYRLLGTSGGTAIPGTTTVTPTGAAEAAGRFGHHTVAVRLAREVGQTYGLGAVGASYDVRIGYGLRLGPRLDLTAGGDYTRLLAGVPPVGAPTAAARVNAGARHELGHGWALQADYSYWHWYDARADWGGHTTALSIRRRFAWR